MTSVWSEHYTKDGRAYYYNRKTKQSAWEKPADFDGEPAVKPAAKASASVSASASASASASTETDKKAVSGGAEAGDWEELWDPKNERHYYYNRATRKTQWQKPENVTIKPYSGATTASATKKEHKHKKSSDKTGDASASAASTEAEESASTGDEKSTTVAEDEPQAKEAGTKLKRSESADHTTTKASTGRHAVEKTEKVDERGSTKSKDKSATPTKKSTTAASPRKKTSSKQQQDTAASTATTTASNRSPRRSLVVDDEDDGDGDLMDEEEEGVDKAVQPKRKKLSRKDLQADLTDRKRQRKDNATRMIICDDEDTMTREANRPIEEQDTDDGKEATRLLQSLSKPDAIMEETVLNLINGFLRAHNASNGPEILVEKLSSSYRGHAQMVGLVASWLDALPVSKTALEHKIAFDVADGSVVQKNTGASWDPASDILYRHLQEIITQQYDPKLVSNVLSGSSTEPEWLTQMLGDRKWRHMLIELAETHKTCSLLQYAIRRISDAGHHKEIASMSSAIAFFSVFNGILLDAFCRIPFASDEDARDDLNALKKICCQSAYSFVYAQELLCAMDTKLFSLQDDNAAAISPAQRAEYRTVRSKLARVRFELQETTIANVGVKIESLHPLRRRYLYDANPRLADAVLSIVKTKKCTEAAAEALAKEYGTPSTAPPVAHLRDPLVFRALLDPLFNPAATLSASFSQHCVYLLAYAACAKDERGILHAGAANANAKVDVGASELEKAKDALQQASTACRDDHTLSFNMNQTGVVEKLTSVMGVPLASMGVLHWIEVTLTSPAFFNSSLLHICFPSLLRILKASIQLHVAQWPIAFRVLVTSLRLHPDVNPVKALELKRESLRSMTFMIRSGYVLPVLEFIFTNTAELDQALLRNFITMLFAQIAPPYSAKFVVALTKMLTHPKVQNALKSCPSECKLKLQNFLSYCKKNNGVLSEDQLHALATSLEGL